MKPIPWLVVGLTLGSLSCAKSDSENRPTSEQSHEAFTSLLVTLGEIHPQLQTGMAGLGYDKVYDDLEQTCDDGFEEYITKLRDGLQDQGWPVAQATLWAEALRKFRNDGVC